VSAPALVVRLGDREWTRVTVPELGARAWILGVVAVQVAARRAQVRAHVTGAKDALVVPLSSGDPVHVTLAPDLRSAAAASPLAPPPSLTALPPLAAAAAALAVFVDGAFVDEARTADSDAADARGFGHVFCRWLRGGAIEPGFDLTDLVAQPAGRKYERRVQRPLAVGATVSYVFRCLG
jgi:hypothetical protein